MYRMVMLLSVWMAVQPSACRMIENGQEGELSGNAVKKSYRWKTGNWGICFSGKGPNSCGQGTRERPVWCVDETEKISLEFLCDAKREPDRTRSCFTACRHHKDKLKWEVGPWGPCSEAENQVGLVYENRPRTDRPHAAEHYGLMQRNVSCVLVSHEDAKLRLIVDEENCFTIARKPDPVRLCNIPKPQDCIVSAFSNWTRCRGCPPEAVRTRIRNVMVAPKNGGAPCPELSETSPCPAESKCSERSFQVSKKQFRLKISAWSKCEVPSAFASAEESEYRYASLPDRYMFPMLDSSTSAESSEKQTIFHARVGFQTREISCKDGRGAVVELSSCDAATESLLPKSRSCIVPQDCIVSEWSAWSVAEEGCIEDDGTVRSGAHERKRQVIRLPEGEGQPCPHLLEKKEASNKEALPLCNRRYKRIPSRWSDCMIGSGSELVKVGCGGGIQLRTVSCVAISSGRPVEDFHCSSAVDSEELPTVQRCEVACPRDCVVGEWGKWGPCLTESCSRNVTSSSEGYRTRIRNVTVQPSAKGLPCPALKEVQPCNDVRCHRWSVGHWGMCVLASPLKCGSGLRKRSIKCIDREKVTVNDALCDNQEKPPREEPCLLPCPFDCVLSPWSEWSPCSHSCSGQKMIALRQRNRTIVAPPGPGGHKCPDPDELMEMEPCNSHGCHGYSWLVLPWQPCTSEDDKIEKPVSFVLEGVKDPALLDAYLTNRSRENEIREDEDREEEDEPKTCGTGIRRREVWCVRNNNIRVPDSKCYPAEKPISVESCVKDCPVNCQLSPWAEWSVCPQECVPDASNEVKDGEVAPTQSRSRVILKNPTNGGTLCQHLDEFRPCPLSAARCKHYQWQLSAWSECQLPANLKCGRGFRTRGVWCSKNQRTTKVSPTFCMENAGPPPALSESCDVDCLRHCVLSHWSSWSKCSSSCRGEAFRTRQLIGHSNSRAACLNSELYPLRESKACPCELYAASAEENWSACILEYSLEKILANGRLAHDTCGSGTRYKRNVCTNSESQIVDSSFCEMENSLVDEPCIVPCPVDCVQSQWSTWSSCSALCGPGLQNRTREVIREPREGGRPCGVSFEVKICNIPCSNYDWVSSGFTQCALKGPDKFRGCGTGQQYRSVRCLNYGHAGAPTQVREEYCDPVTRPENTASCRIACPGECVVSPWSAWSECDEACSESKQRQRTRVLLRAPSQETSATDFCPRLIQVQNCQMNVTCFSHSWRVTPYGSCLPLGGSPCGEGIQTRAVYCRRSDGRSVDDFFCDAKTKPAATEKWCYLGCPVDCELTSWSQWDSSECVCGSGTGLEYRRRKITTSPSSSGRPCPGNLEQSRPCRVEPCYKWVRGPWSPCSLEGADCGHGISYRNISCLRGSSEVGVEECLASSSLKSPRTSEVELLKMELFSQTNCYVPCHGDCEVSEWSEWSHCHRNCRDNPTGGYRTRSRAILKKATSDGEPCPSVLWETKPCTSGICLTFAWVVRNGSIHCLRSDGSPAIGGCDEKRKPCLRNCSLVRNSHCSGGRCTCLDGYRPRSGGEEDVADCVPAKEGVSINQKLSHPDNMAEGEDMLRSHLLYLPNDEFNIWMFAMIGIGCLFVVFVAVSFYLMCHNSNRNSQENGTQVLNASKP